MATVEVAFTPLPAHVRTARLVATAVARRSGVAESLLDEVRLAVGEACSRAVEAHRRYCPAQPVRLELRHLDGRFEVTVIDAASTSGDPLTGDDLPVPVPASPSAGVPDDQTWVSSASFGLGVICGLVDDVRIASTDRGLSIRMRWPASGVTA